MSPTSDLLIVKLHSVLTNQKTRKTTNNEGNNSFSQNFTWIGDLVFTDSRFLWHVTASNSEGKVHMPYTKITVLARAGTLFENLQKKTCVLMAKFLDFANMRLKNGSYNLRKVLFCAIFAFKWFINIAIV